MGDRGSADRDRIAAFNAVALEGGGDAFRSRGEPAVRQRLTVLDKGLDGLDAQPRERE